jgi:hypothetical protein
MLTRCLRIKLMTLIRIAVLSMVVFIKSYSQETNVSTKVTPQNSDMHNVNGNIKFLWAVPLEQVRFFSPEGNQMSLAPDWMRDDLNKVAVELYKRFLTTVDLTHIDSRDAESIAKAFKEYQLGIFKDSRGLFNSTVLFDHFGNVTDNLRDSILGAESFRVLLGKVATDFTGKMLFLGGTKFLYQARIWAEVLGAGDAIQSHNYATSGAAAAGVVFTNLPNGTVGTPRIELLDPRGHNPPFGKDEFLTATTGVGFLYPGWVNRLTVPHRCCSNEYPADPSDLLTSHRIDWAFEIGLFQYPEPVLNRFFDLEKCPFQKGFMRPDAQLFFNLDVEELAKLEFQGLPEYPRNNKLPTT